MLILFNKNVCNAVARTTVVWMIKTEYVLLACNVIKTINIVLNDYYQVLVALIDSNSKLKWF